MRQAAQVKPAAQEWRAISTQRPWKSQWRMRLSAPLCVLGVPRQEVGGGAGPSVQAPNAPWAKDLDAGQVLLGSRAAEFTGK